jgi:hypothetical protein
MNTHAEPERMVPTAIQNQHISGSLRDLSGLEDVKVSSDLMGFP